MSKMIRLGLISSRYIGIGMTYRCGTKSTRAAAHLVSIFFLAIATGLANAQSINPGLDDIIQVRLGPLFADFETTVTIQGSTFDQEQLSDRETTVAGFAKWRITPKFHFNIGYSKIDRDDETTLNTAMAIGGLTVPAGTSLSQAYETSSLPITLAYAFVKNPKTEFGVDAGVNVTTIKNRISISVPGTPTLTPINQDVTEPLPTIGLFWNQAFSPQWMFTARLGYMGLEIGGLDGDFYNANAAIEWRPWKNVGFGASYLFNSADGNITSGGTTTTFDYEYHGPFMYLVFGGGTR